MLLLLLYPTFTAWQCGTATFAVSGVLALLPFLLVAGQYCDIGNRCLITSPCLNGGVCQPSGSSYYCQCRTGYFGTGCELRDTCRQQNPCRNNGQCVTTGGGGYYCICQAGYSGPQCDLYNACYFSNPCLNGGSCQPQGNAYWCVCRAGHEGQRCEHQTLASRPAGSATVGLVNPVVKPGQPCTYTSQGILLCR